MVSGWWEGGGGRSGLAAGSLHSAAVVAQHLALLAQVLGMLLALVGHVQAVGLLQGSLQRGRREWRGRQKHKEKQGE